MGDWFLVTWAVAGMAVALGTAGGTVWVGRRRGRRWHEMYESVAAFVGATVAVYALTAMWLGPWKAMLAIPASVLTLIAAAVGVVLFVEWRAKRAVLARERGA